MLKPSTPSEKRCWRRPAGGICRNSLGFASNFRRTRQVTCSSVSDPQKGISEPYVLCTVDTVDLHFHHRPEAPNTTTLYPKPETPNAHASLGFWRSPAAAAFSLQRSSWQPRHGNPFNLSAFSGEPLKQDQAGACLEGLGIMGLGLGSEQGLYRVGETEGPYSCPAAAASPCSRRKALPFQSVGF